MLWQLLCHLDLCWQLWEFVLQASGDRFFLLNWLVCVDQKPWDRILGLKWPRKILACFCDRYKCIYISLTCFSIWIWHTLSLQNMLSVLSINIWNHLREDVLEGCVRALFLILLFLLLSRFFWVSNWYLLFFAFFISLLSIFVLTSFRSYFFILSLSWWYFILS